MAANEPSPDRDRLTATLSPAAIDAAAQAAVTAAADGELIAIGYIGIDHFALLNETYGSVVTDQLIRQVAARIQESLRPQDVVGRVERAEFMIVFRKLSTKFETLALASRLRTSIAEPMRAGTSEERLAPGCGIAQFPANGKTVEELRAYAAKSMQTLLIAMRSQSVATAQEAINKARATVDAAQAELEAAEAAYEQAVAHVAAANAAAAAAEANATVTEAAAEAAAVQALPEE
jgi:diguanylate cyclase (GGDEF)-like protein